LQHCKSFRLLAYFSGKSSVVLFCSARFYYFYFIIKIANFIKTMAPAFDENSGLSEYEKQRNRNIAENRKILESIRQEQVFI
jgi:hypothetical protein